jgi:diacylglycerol kinase family enzyme
VDGTKHVGVTAIAQNSDPFTYFAEIPIEICEQPELDDGKLGVAVLRRAAQRDMVPIAARVLGRRLRASRGRQIEVFEGVGEASVRSLSRDASGALRPMPVQVDGNYLGEHAELHWSIDPQALTVVA